MYQFETLRVYHNARNLVEEIDKLTKQLPNFLRIALKFLYETVTGLKIAEKLFQSRSNALIKSLKN